MKIGIIGLGLMGGSLALSLKELSFVSEVVGHDHNLDHQNVAMEFQLIDKIVSFEVIKKCDVIILSVPVNAILSILNELHDVNEKTTIIDLGSTKETIVNSISPSIRKNLVAAHPMTGTENFGPTAAIHDLYKNKVVVLCDLEDSGEYQQEVAVRLFSGIHMQLRYMKAHDHDRHAAYISHMPHIISFSIANTVLSQEEKENILLLAAGGFRSMSRLAKSSPKMWEDIFRQNRENLLNSIEHFEHELSRLKKSIKSENWEDLNKQMREANRLQEMFK
ncbi:MAG: prephenate dehydrogenase [Campylobacterota bacterium]|nr:prephenate dehydrogenase [Campylobacterota bacterium]